MGKAPDLDYISASLRPLAQPLHNLHPDQRNARRHDERNIDAIADSLRQFGQQKPIVVQKNGKGFNVLAGNGTLRAALKLGWTHLAAAEFDRDDTGAAVAFGIADNRTAELAEWDGEMVAGLLEDLAGEYSPADLGFTDDELDGLLADEPSEVVEDEVPEPPADPVTKPGDLWTLGDHRLLCGDCTSADNVARLMDGASIVVVITDPPYGVSVVKNGMVGADFGVAKKGKYLPVIGDEKPPQLGELIKAYDKLIIWGGNYFAYQLPVSASWLIWDKRTDSGIENTFADCELAWSNIGCPARVHRQLWNGMIREGEHDPRLHPTQKPIALLIWCINKTTGIVYDPFLGSGTTLIAAEQTGRRCYGMEISPAYCDVIVQRWENLTGGKATRG